jgi:7-carboxy-7-deazaguanine synthase
MAYVLKEIHVTLQGEGAQAGRVSVFARFAGCNLWSGREQDRATAPCWFCDTDFLGTDGPGGGRWQDPQRLAEHLRDRWTAEAGPGGRPYVVFTGGEPLLQLDEPLIDACHAVGLEVAVETNGTIAVPDSVDWVCVSPKPGGELVQRAGDELKLVFPQEVTPEDVGGLAFEHWFLQPRDGDDQEANTAATIQYCRLHPKWRLSVQTHKLLGIP